MISRFVSLSPVLGSVLAAQSLEPASDSESPSLSLLLPCSLSLSLSLSKINKRWVAWVAQSVKQLTSAQVMISQFMSSSPPLGSVLTAQNLEPALDSVSPSLSASPLLMLFSLSQK